MWQKRVTKLQVDQASLLQMNQTLKEDNKELMMQVDKYINKVKE